MTVDSDGPEDRPDWWAENARRREEMDLPPHRPPRSEDGTYTHEIVPKLEDEHDRSIRFASLNPSYPEDWPVEVGGRPLVSECAHPSFRDELRSYLDRAASGGDNVPHDLGTAFAWDERASPSRRPPTRGVAEPAVPSATVVREVDAATLH